MDMTGLNNAPHADNREIQNHVIDVFFQVRSWKRVREVLLEHDYQADRADKLIEACKTRVDRGDVPQTATIKPFEPHVLHKIREHQSVVPKPDENTKQYRLGEVLAWSIVSALVAGALLAAFWFARL